MATNYNYFGGIVTNGLVLDLDAAKLASYPGTGTAWRDISGNNNNGTLTNGPTFSGIGKQASIVFDGTDDRVTITNPLLSSTGNWTVSSWFNFSVLNIDLTNGSTAALYNQYIASTGNGRIVFRIFNDGSVINKLQLFLGSGSNYGNQFITGTTTITTNTFYNFVVSRNGSTFTTYINGVLEVSSTLTGINVTILQSTPEIGGITSGNFGWLNGRVYNTSIYNRALTEAEIQRNFQATRFRYGI
mgnify:CR=1 FL=1